ncbi:hypothetical protein BRC86_11425 [Halobacteriales archaeon QS_3_64_16]|nr:MAG: hypothetical protein BRC86_11425 [Halobacteriales archaeon QS_3_64_16]
MIPSGWARWARCSIVSERPNSLHLGVLGGTGLPGNVRTFLSNFRTLLQEALVDFDCDLILSDDVVPISGYRTIDPGIGDPDCAVDVIRTLTTATTAYARSRPVDLFVQVTKFPVHGVASVLAGRRTGVPVLTRLAGDNFREHRLSTGPADRARTFALNNLLGRLPVRLADATIVLGPHGREAIRSRNAGATVHEIPQPVDRERFSRVTSERRRALRADLGMPSVNESRVLLTVGRLTRRKGTHHLLRAARELAARGINYRWYVLGDGPLGEELPAVPLIESVGRVPHDRIADYYRAADLLVHPSLIEGLPNVLLEATACGLPSLARDVGECGTVASRTYDDPSALSELVTYEYERPTLDERFDPDRLREAFVETLVETAATGAQYLGANIS